MSETEPGSTFPSPPYPQERTSEQHAMVRRRALPVAVCGAISGIGGLIWLSMVHITPFTPPNPIAANLSICSLLMGVGILFYAKGTSGTRPTVIFCIVAIIGGLIGPLIFAKQTVDYRRLAEDHELGNVAAIASGARQFATDHGGAYPTDLLTLLEAKGISPENLQSPFGRRHELFEDFAKAQRGIKRDDLLKTVDEESDYQYFGGDLKWSDAAEAKNAWPQIIVSASKAAVMRVNLALAFADGNSRFIGVEEAEGVLAACNQARGRMRLPQLRPPTVIQAALDEASTMQTAK